MEEMKQYFGVLQQLKDFDEKKSLEMAARAYQEQEMKKLEVRAIASRMLCSYAKPVGGGRFKKMSFCSLI